MIGRNTQIAAATAAAFLLASCGPTSYPKEKLAGRLMAVCKQEYGLNVKAQVIGTTLGAQVVIPGLIDELRKHVPSALPAIPPVLVEGHYAEQVFDFRMFTRGVFFHAEPKIPEDSERPREPAAPLKKLQQVSTAVMRSSLSTDAPLEFYKLIARDPGPDRLDVVLSGHILDSKRVQFYMISVGDLQGRNEISLRRQPEEVARSTVAGFIADLSRRPLPQLLSRYTSPSKRFGEILPMVLSVAAELKGEQMMKMNPDEWPVRQIKKDAVLVWVPLAPVGGEGSFLFTVELVENGGTLLSIDKLKDSALPPAYRSLGPPERWADSFYLEPISLPEFVTEQIAKRVMSQYKSADVPADPKKKKKADSEKPATIQDVTKSLLGAAAYVTESYSFKDFREVTAVDTINGTRWTVPAAQIPLYRRRDAPELKPVP